MGNLIVGLAMECGVLEIRRVRDLVFWKSVSFAQFQIVSVVDVWASRRHITI